MVGRVARQRRGGKSAQDDSFVQLTAELIAVPFRR